MASEKEEVQVFVPKNQAAVQRLKLEKLMKNPDKPVHIPDRKEDKLPRAFRPPEFVRNIWGSSAGAGSGEFHVYRGIRRREYARQKYEKEKDGIDEKEEKFQQKVKENKKAAEDKTAKKRAKRQKQKQRQKNKKQKLQKDDKGKQDSESEDEEEDEDNEEDTTDNNEK